MAPGAPRGSESMAQVKVKNIVLSKLETCNNFIVKNCEPSAILTNKKTGVKLGVVAVGPESKEWRRRDERTPQPNSAYSYSYPFFRGILLVDICRLTQVEVPVPNINKRT